jgi:DNA polymerase-3 subunit alpha
MTVRAAHKGDMAPVDAEWSEVEESTRQRQRLGVSLGTHPLQSLREELSQWRAPRGGTKPVPLHRIPDTNGESTITVGVISFWEEKGYSGGRRANFSLESSKVTIRGVIWDRALSGLRTRNAIPKVGDVVAVSGRVNVRVTAIGDSDADDNGDGQDGSETQETITTKEISANEIWQIAGVTPPEIREPAAVIDFASKYRQLRGEGPAPDQPQEPAEEAAEDADPATVTSLEEKRARSRWCAVQIGRRKNTLASGVHLDGDTELLKVFARANVPVGMAAGTIYRVVAPTGRATVVVPSPSLTGQKLLELAHGVEDEDPRWSKVSDGSFTWFLLDQGAAATGAEGIAA